MFRVFEFVSNFEFQVSSLVAALLRCVLCVSGERSERAVKYFLCKLVLSEHSRRISTKIAANSDYSRG